MGYLSVEAAVDGIKVRETHLRSLGQLNSPSDG